MNRPNPPNLPVVHDVARQCFEVHLEPEPAFLRYHRAGGAMVLTHTCVPVALRGRGIAAALVRAALGEARRQHWTIVPQCSYVAAFLKRHPDVAGDTLSSGSLSQINSGLD